MAKSPSEPITMPSYGRWDWNDETKTLEFIRFEPKEEVKEKKKTNTSKSQEQSRKPLEKWQTNTVRPAQLEAFKTSIKHSQMECVTIQDVKLAAVCLLHKNDRFPIPSRFLSLLKSKELDELLGKLLLYFSCYFEKKALEEKPTFVIAGPSLLSDSEMQMNAKLELAQRQFAVCYFSLQLKLLPHQHQISDRIRMSLNASIDRDMQLNECLLRFYSYASWVTFERRGLKGIRMEIGRLFGSNVFNPAPNESKKEWKDQESSQKSPSKVLNSRQTSLNNWKSNRLPPLNKIITQRSPLMVSLLPTPQEKAPHLFERFRGPQVPSTEDCDSEAVMEELKEQLKEQLSFGILGRPLSQFSPETLKPQEGPSEEETENEEDEGSNSEVVSADPRVLIKTSVTGQRSLTTAADKRMRSSRADLVSRATTEAVSSDTE
ncbi:protein phosphatase 1 regulatory subunit 36 isoform X2 [Carassius carassius]|uniref:protein phosphatase 1 regulatory subunit 36 isoform X2 n=1 Tax=Carassius carassius TaxID=217509 RepID=UPI002869500D|nr:protein phosphatase 1 regulatory subunit 36 isoform X2 [Carassius carassius]